MNKPVSGNDKTDDNIDFSIGTYLQDSLNTPASLIQRGIEPPELLSRL